MVSPSAFLFDIGNVILPFDFQKTLARIKDDCALPPAESFSAVSELMNPFESGEMSSEAFVAEAIERIGFSGEKATFIQALKDIFDPNEAMIEFIEAQSEKKIPLYLLSNTNGLHVEFFTKEYPVFELFDGAIYSHEAKSMKPDDPIYEVAIERFNLSPKTTVYIDDRPENIEAGRRHQLISMAYDFRNHEAFLAEYEALLTNR